MERWRAQTRPAHAQCSSAHARAGKGAEKSVHCLSCLEGGERLEAAEDSEVVTEIEATVASWEESELDLERDQTFTTEKDDF